MLFMDPCFPNPCQNGDECEIDWINFVSIFKRTSGYCGRYCDSGKPFSDNLWLINFDKSTHYE